MNGKGLTYGEAAGKEKRVGERLAAGRGAAIAGNTQHTPPLGLVWPVDSGPVRIPNESVRDSISLTSLGQTRS